MISKSLSGLSDCKNTLRHLLSTLLWVRPLIVGRVFCFGLVYVFIYLRICLFLVVLGGYCSVGFPLVAASGLLWLQRTGFSLRWLLVAKHGL